MRKRKVRAGHKGSITRIIPQVHEMLDSEEKDETKLTQQLQTLKEKRKTLSKIDLEILDLLTDEQEIVNEITQANAFRESADLTVIQIQSALKCLNVTMNPQHIIPEPERSPRQLQAGPNVSSPPVHENPARVDSPVERSSIAYSQDKDQPTSRSGPKVKLP